MTANQREDFKRLENEVKSQEEKCQGEYRFTVRVWGYFLLPIFNMDYILHLVFGDQESCFVQEFFFILGIKVLILIPLFFFINLGYIRSGPGDLLGLSVLICLIISTFRTSRSNIYFVMIWLFNMGMHPSGSFVNTLEKYMAKIWAFL